MNHEEQVKHIDRKVDELEDRFDRHLEIYANNGKELAGLKVEVASMKKAIENLTQQISAVGSDVKAIVKTMNEYTDKIDGLEKDKTKRDGWIEWLIKTVFGVLILGVLVAIGINLK